jgi:hypothetical protein
MMVIEPTYGLCNKLRVLFSYYKLAKEKKETLYVIWKSCAECPGFFLDYFQPIEGIVFLHNNIQKLKIEYSGCEIIQNYPPDYKELKLIHTLFEKIMNRIQLLNSKYIALHIRRTDHIRLAKLKGCFTSDEEFFDFIEKELKNGNETTNLYIATDNKETYIKYYNKYNSLMKIKYHPTKCGIRKTTLENSIIDLYMCVYATEFMGSGWSSFSKTIMCLRNNLKNQ